MQAGSRVCLRNLTKAHQYNDQKADVIRYNQSKVRWEVRLINPTFQGKQILVAEDNLEFLFMSSAPNLGKASNLLQSSDSPVTLGATTALGRVLRASRRFAPNELVFAECPFLVVSSPDSDQRWLRRVECYCELLRTQQHELICAFNDLSDGGTGVIDSLRADAEQAAETLWESTPVEARGPNPHAEVDNLASICARWQTNQHELPSMNGVDTRGLFFLCPILPHSCDPNIGYTIGSGGPWEREARAMRTIEPGEILSASYVDVSFLTGSVEERRQLLQRQRHFRCCCDRCEEESGEKAVTDEHITDEVAEALVNESAEGESDEGVGIVLEEQHEVVDERVDSGCSNGEVASKINVVAELEDRIVEVQMRVTNTMAALAQGLIGEGEANSLVTREFNGLLKTIRNVDHGS